MEVKGVQAGTHCVWKRGSLLIDSFGTVAACGFFCAVDAWQFVLLDITLEPGGCMNIYILVPLVLLACGISFFIGWFLNQKSGQNKVTTAQDRAAKILSVAEKEAETLKRE